MGLLKEALLSTQDNNKTQKTALLAKIENFPIESCNFFQWTASMHFEHAAVLDKYLTKYCISHAAGIDAETVTASVSACDFWNGTLSDNTEGFTADFGTKKAEPFYQLLSN